MLSCEAELRAGAAALSSQGGDGYGYPGQEKRRKNQVNSDHWGLRFKM